MVYTCCRRRLLPVSAIPRFVTTVTATAAPLSASVPARWRRRWPLRWLWRWWWKRGGAIFFAPESYGRRHRRSRHSRARNNFHFSPSCVGPCHVSDPEFHRTPVARFVKRYYSVGNFWNLFSSDRIIILANTVYLFGSTCTRDIIILCTHAGVEYAQLRGPRRDVTFARVDIDGGFSIRKTLQQNHLEFFFMFISSSSYRFHALYLWTRHIKYYNILQSRIHLTPAVRL